MQLVQIRLAANIREFFGAHIFVFVDSVYVTFLRPGDAGSSRSAETGAART